MATKDNTIAETELAPSGIPIARIEAALEAGYELESLAVNFPIFRHDENTDLSDEYHQKLFIRRIKELASVVMSALDDDREINELRRIVGLKEVIHE